MFKQSDSSNRQKRMIAYVSSYSRQFNLKDNSQEQRFDNRALLRIFKIVLPLKDGHFLCDNRSRF